MQLQHAKGTPVMRWLVMMAMLTASGVAATGRAQEAIGNVVLGIHGGTGRAKAEMTPELDRQLRAALEVSLKAGYAELQKPGSTSLDAVEAAIHVLEDSPLFNAGKGAVFTHQGRNELDASIMEGQTLMAGAVAGVTRIKNPITAARAVMEKTKHVMLIADGADTFAKEIGLEIVDPSYFRTEERWQQLQKQLEEEKRQPQGQAAQPKRYYELGTVGAVALDSRGLLSAGTSTGGMSNKRFGRVGDSPIIGAGTYADNESCAISCTGHGEYFIRYAVSHTISDLMKYKDMSVEQAADRVINKTLKQAGGEGAAIALDAKGNFAMAYNSEGLYRAYITKDGKIKVMLYED
jgi:beta-aspartyl-peptidase (threonine type)